MDWAVGHIDFETRSECPLASAGAAVYAEHPSTEVLIMCWKVQRSDGTWARGRWFPGMPFPWELIGLDAYYAHNAAFEIAVWTYCCTRKYGWGECPPADRWVCTMNLAALSGMPLGLDKAAHAAGLSVSKDMEGHRIMLKHCKPRAPRKGEDPNVVHWFEDPEERAKLYDYCDADVDVEEELAHRTTPPTALEAETMIVNRQINTRGVRIDRAAVQGAINIAVAEQKRLNRRMAMLTNGRARTTDQVAVILDVVRGHGVELDNLRAETLRDWFAENGEESGVEAAMLAEMSGTGVAGEILDTRAEAAKASVKKLRAMDRSANADDRLRNLHEYGGAYRTLRFAGRRVQTQNMVRGNPPKEVPEELWFDALASGDIEYFRTLLPTDPKTGEQWSVMDGLRVSLRGMIQAPEDSEYAVADESQIEARVLPWLAGQLDSVEAFERYDEAVHAHGGESPEAKALDIYTVQSNSAGLGDRQAGKVAVLGCGFGASHRAIIPFAKGYGLMLDETSATALVKSWRGANPLVVRFWNEEETCAKQAIRAPGNVIDRGRTGHWIYDAHADVLHRFLPSGRSLKYLRPRIERRMMPWGEWGDQITYEGGIYRKGMPGVFIRVSTYGGKLAENITQAVARDVLAVSLCRAARAGLATVMHTHDEQVVEILKGLRDVVRPKLVAAMTDPIRWLPGLPMNTSCDFVERYAKL